MLITIVDYGVGNIKSLSNAVGKYCDVRLSHREEEINSSDALIFPGVGSFVSAMDGIRSRNLEGCIKSFITHGRMVLGVCLGMQIFFESSEESDGVSGLGVIGGRVRRLDKSDVAKIPNIGWNKIIQQDENDELFQDIDSDYMYFCHSYVAPRIRETTSVSKCGEQYFCSSLEKENLIGTQFHPEKSGVGGLKIIQNFVSMVKNVRSAVRS
jgi:imidazole glycerol phosphate synthase glutamine amidotransferase subunit